MAARVAGIVEKVVELEQEVVMSSEEVLRAVRRESEG